MDAMVSKLEESRNPDLSEERPSKRQKIDSESEMVLMRGGQSTHVKRRWRTESEQQSYSSKLVEALRRVSQKSGSVARSSIDGRKVRETADRVLAVAAKGKTRWSRAILTSRLTLKLKKHKKAKQAVAGCSRPKRTEIRCERRKLPAVHRKVRTLGRLVPGCRKLSFPNLLEEATDYIAALQMQVRAMTAVADLLSSAPADHQGSRPDS